MAAFRIVVVTIKMLVKDPGSLWLAIVRAQAIKTHPLPMPAKVRQIKTQAKLVDCTVKTFAIAARIKPDLTRLWVVSREKRPARIAVAPSVAISAVMSRPAMPFEKPYPPRSSGLANSANRTGEQIEAVLVRANHTISAP